MREHLERIKEYGVSLFKMAKSYRFWVVAGIVIALVVSITFVGARVIDLAFHRERNIPQSKLSGIVCKDYEKRPIAVTLANDPAARPLSGLSDAEFVFEIPVTPDGITRTMAVYQCNHPKEIGSIRSARDGFLDLALGMDAILAHWGGEARSLEKLDKGILDNLNALIYEGSVFYRKPGIRAPHNGFTSFDNLLNQAVALGYETKTTSFEGYPRLKGRKDIGEERKLIRIYEPPHRVEWFYNEDDNTYLRYRSGVSEIDGAKNVQIEANVVIVVKTTSSVYSVDYLDVDLVGSGEMSVYQNGREIQGKWRKASQTAPLEFLDFDNQPVELMPGITWVEVTI